MVKNNSIKLTVKCAIQHVSANQCLIHITIRGEVIIIVQRRTDEEFQVGEWSHKKKHCKLVYGAVFIMR